jgi:hypothetical protein
VASALKDLCEEVEKVREGDIAKPVREIAPISLHVQQLATQCTRQFHDLSTSQYAWVKGGEENLARLAGACSQRWLPRCATWPSTAAQSSCCTRTPPPDQPRPAPTSQ